MGPSPLIYSGVIIILVLISGIYINSAWQWNDQVRSPLLNPVPSQPLDLSSAPGEIPSRILVIINETRQSLDLIAAIPDENRTTINTVIRFEEIMTACDDQTLLLSLIADENPDPVVTSEARNGIGIRDAFLNEVYLRSDMAHALSVVVPEGKEEQILRQKHLENFNFAALPEDKKTKLMRPLENLSAHEKQYAVNQQAGNASSNLNLMSRIIADRQEIVSLLGYPSFADYQIARSGILSDSECIRQTLYTIASPICRLSHDEAAVLLKKKQITDPNATGVFDYEIALLKSRLLNATGQISPNDVSPFFPVGPVLGRMNQVFSRIFGISISPVDQVPQFSPDFTLYRITDPETDEIRGWFYLGIRSDQGLGTSSGKTYYLRAGREENGTWIPAVSAIILTTPDITDTDRDVFTQAELQTLFHEYGHMLVHSLATSRYATLTSGAHESSGYIEIPPLFLEQFLWNPEILDQISGTRDGTKMPKMMQDQIIRSGGRESEYTRVYDVFLSLLDLSLNAGNETPDFLNLYSTLYEDCTGFQSTSGGSALLMNPAFFISGNAGTYWHYVLDNAYAHSLFERFIKAGVMNQSNGISFREKFFEPAGAEDSVVRMRNFLGRDPDVIRCSHTS
ncbi:MAG: hypothetical protein CVV33_07030 [Methanomicrobiales archaeon HGW-Methanomicrobiales-4]|nr:MAG: hypothetical protein CVV33_07030 [Methanomicrobiales archaeon HGW-Methanomicrobiales-4]